MPPDRGTVKKTTSIKRDSSRENKPSTTRKDDKDKSRSSRSKAEPVKSRDESSSRSKERKSKDDKSKTVSNPSKEKLPSKQRIDTEKMRAINKDVSSDKGKVRELLAKNRSSTESRTVSKPKVASNQSGTRTSKAAEQSGTRTSKAAEGAPLRSQLSYRSGPARSTSERSSKALPDTPSKKTVVTKSSTSKVSLRESSTRQDVDGKRKKPSEEKREREPHQSRSSEVQSQKPKRDRTRTRTLSPREVKIVKSAAEVVKKETPKPAVHKPLDRGDDPSTVVASSEAAAEDEYDYEDDFEDYESDFEEDVDSDVSDEVDAGSDSDSTESDIAEDTPRPPVEEEKKLDSGNYDLTESKKRGRQDLKEIIEAIERENSALPTRGRNKEQQVVQRAVAADEGFEEDDKPPDESSKPTTTTFINFTNAKQRMLEKKLTARAKRRGEQLLDMIRLDVMSFSLFELSPMPYELFMKSYGRSNTTQVHVQTNEENLSEEIQTDEILMKNKWTQKPVTFHANKEEDPLTTFSRDRLGVGGDDVDKDPDSWKQRVRGNAHRLNEFLSSAGQVVLRLLESSSSSCGSQLTTSERLPAFSDGYLSLRAEDVPFLAGRPVTLVCFPPHSASTLLTVHATVPLEDGELDALLDRCMICIWSLLAPSSPQAILISSHEVTAACFEPTTGCLVLGGLSDGSVCVWDLREPASNHRLTRNRALRSPTYSTAEILRNEGHLTEVVALQPLTEPVGNGELSEVSPIQVCSLEEAGTLIVWTLLQSFEQRSSLVQQDLGLAHWGRVRLVRTTSISLADSVTVDLQCVDLQIDGGDPNHLYVSTTAGVVVHCLKNGGKPRPRLYTAVEGFSVASCLESCPFSQPFFLVGCEDGAIRLHSRWNDKPLTTLAGTGDAPGQGAAVRSIQWSTARPGIFFVLDSQSRVHVWDLGESDIHPVQTAQLDKKVTAMWLSPHQGAGKGSQHLALSTSCGQVQVHKLKAGLSYQSPALFTQELERFLLYASAS